MIITYRNAVRMQIVHKNGSIIDLTYFTVRIKEYVFFRGRVAYCAIRMEKSENNIRIEFSSKTIEHT